MDNIEKLLRKSDLFKDFDRSALSRISSEGKLQALPRNNMLFYESEEGKLFYVLVKGSIKLFKSAPDGKEIIVKLIRPGEIFAEVILFEDNCYPVSAISVTSSEIFAIHKDHFLHLLDDHDFRYTFIATLMRKQRYLAQRILYLTAYDVEERFFSFLLERYGKHDNYTINLSKKDIASAIGTIPETLSRLLMRLKKRKLIHWEGTTLKVKKNIWETYDSLQ